MDSAVSPHDAPDQQDLSAAVRRAVAEAFSDADFENHDSGAVVIHVPSMSAEIVTRVVVFNYDDPDDYPDNPRHVAGGQALLFVQSHTTDEVGWRDLGEINVLPTADQLITTGALHDTEPVDPSIIDQIRQIPAKISAALGLQLVGEVRVAPRLTSTDRRVTRSRNSLERVLLSQMTLPDGWHVTRNHGDESRFSQPPLVSVVKETPKGEHHVSLCAADPSLIDSGSAAEAIATRARLLDPFVPRTWHLLDLRGLSSRMLGSTDRSRITINTWSPGEIFAFTRQSFDTGTKAGTLAVLAQRLASDAGNISGGMTSNYLEQVSDADLSVLGLCREDLAMLQHRAVLVRALERTPAERASSVGSLALVGAHETGHELVYRTLDALKAQNRDADELWTRVGDVAAAQVSDQHASHLSLAMLRHVLNRLALVGSYGAQNRGEFVAEATAIWAAHESPPEWTTQLRQALIDLDHELN